MGPRRHSSTSILCFRLPRRVYVMFCSGAFYCSLLQKFHASPAYELSCKLHTKVCCPHAQRTTWRIPA